ncbi:lactosylceramide 4-alpha-galactosyltransferase-like [Punica granatum]|nr:lactosylceramide 4-alpha-galactosyltransferase-like [Punica granatum]OWM81717.1 hypothetical protein CDL15_Pgr007755 [Punica granatum]
MKFFEQDECTPRFFMTWLLPAKQFGPREFLSIDSLFKAHPSGCLLIISSSMDSIHGLRILKPLIRKGFRMLSVTPDLLFLVENTPARAWFKGRKDGKRDPGVISLGQNLSNLMRLAFLDRYGGAYMDTDFIVLRKFDGFRNTIGAQTMEVVSSNGTTSHLTLNNAVLVFGPEQPLVYKFLEEFASTFNGSKWGFKGTSLGDWDCQEAWIEARTGHRPYRRGQLHGSATVSVLSSDNYTVLPPEAFYPVDWNRIRKLFRRPRSKSEAQWVKDQVVRLSRIAYGVVHLWNRRSRRLRIEEGSVMERLMLDHRVFFFFFFVKFLRDKRCFGSANRARPCSGLLEPCS